MLGCDFMQQKNLNICKKINIMMIKHPVTPHSLSFPATERNNIIFGRGEGNKYKMLIEFFQNKENSSGCKIIAINYHKLITSMSNVKYGLGECSY